MGKLTIDLPDGAHQSLRMLVASRGMTMKQFVMDKLLPEAAALAVTMPWEMKHRTETGTGGDIRNSFGVFKHVAKSPLPSIRAEKEAAERGSADEAMKGVRKT